MLTDWELALDRVAGERQREDTSFPHSGHLDEGSENFIFKFQMASPKMASVLIHC